MIEIVKPGFLATIQDQGRIGYQRYGVPACGAMDWVSFTEANLLAGNPWNEAAIEFTAIGPTLSFQEDAIFALAGGDFLPSLNGSPIAMNQAHFAHKGDLLVCGSAQRGFRGYLAVSGGFSLKKSMGSYSTCLAAGFGGMEGRVLREGDRIPLRGSQLWLKGLPQRKLPEKPVSNQPIRVILGSQVDVFSPEGIDRFFSAPYKLTQQCDRMGFRLEGAAIALKPGRSPNILSDGVAMGSIQVPNGQPIIMMADRQTTGGYVKLGGIIAADLPQLAQKRPGDSVSFVQVSVQEGQKLLRKQYYALRNLEQDLNREGLW